MTDKTKVTLNEYLTLINSLEDGLIELNPKELGIVFDGIKEKIDGYVELSQYMKDRATGIKDRSKKLLQQAKYLENSEKRLKQHLAFLLDSNDTPEINGNIWKVAVRRSKKVVTTSEPDETMQAAFPELMTQKVEYSWDKKAIKKVLNNDPSLLGFADLEDSLSINVRVNK